MAEFDGKVFYKDGWDSQALGGYFYRDHGLIEFLKKIESNPDGGTVVGIRFDGNKVEVIYEPHSPTKELEEDIVWGYI